MKIRNVLSLFDGISCGQLALHKAGIQYDTYYASEIDKNPIYITQYNFPNTIQLGDVEKWEEWDIDWSKIDLLIGGSPCTNLSIAGNREGLEGEESRLFYSYVDILNHIKKFNPNIKFLLENVDSMSDENKGIINNYMGCKPVMINSALLSAQNRKRYYWVNWNLKKESLFGLPTCTIPQPKDKGIVLKDILESSIKEVKELKEKDNIICEPICVNGQSGRADGLAKQPSCADRIYDINGKSVALASGWKQNIADPICDFVKKKYDEFAEEKGYIPVKFNSYNKQEITEKAPTQTCTSNSQTTSSTVMMFEPVRIGALEGLSNGQANRIYSVRGKSVCLNANGGGGGAKTGLYKINLPDGDYIIRKLTPIECERLQTVPDNYTEYGLKDGDKVKISNSARYKALGNGWTIDVISYLFSFLV